MKIAINIISKMALSLIFFLCIGTTTSYAQWEEELPPVCVGDCDGNGGDDDGGGGCTDPCSCYGDCGGGDDDGGGCTDPCSCYGDCNGSDGSSGGGNNGGGSGSNWSNASEFGTPVNFTIASSNNPIRLRVYTVNSLPATETIPIGLMILEIGEIDLSGLITDYEEATGDYGSLNSPDLLMYNLEYHRDNANNLSEFAAASYGQEINGYNATLQFFNWIAEGLVADLSGDYPGGVRVHGDPTPFETYYLDKDGDGYYYEARQAQRPLTPDWKNWTNGIDCDDTNAAITTGCSFDTCETRIGYLPLEAVENTNDVPGRDLGNATTLATAILRNEAGYRISATNCNTGRVPLGSVVKVTGNGTMRDVINSDGSTGFSGFYPVEYDECSLANRDLICTPEPFGYKGTDGKRVVVILNGDTLEYSNNISNDLKTLIDLANQTCSMTLKNQILETSKSLTEIEVEITDEPSDCCLGKHQVYDSNGNLLDWIGGGDGDFNGTPEYASDDVGAYKKAKITIFRMEIENTGTENGYGNAQYGRPYAPFNQPPVNLTLEEAILATFSHESHHDTDEEFIQDLRNRRNGEENENIDAHFNIHPREHSVWNELGGCN